VGSDRPAESGLFRAGVGQFFNRDRLWPSAKSQVPILRSIRALNRPETEMDVIWTNRLGVQLPGLQSHLLLRRASACLPSGSQLQTRCPTPGNGTCSVQHEVFQKTRSWKWPMSVTRTTTGNRLPTRISCHKADRLAYVQQEKHTASGDVLGSVLETVRSPCPQQLHHLLLAWQQFELPIAANILQRANS